MFTAQLVGDRKDEQLRRRIVSVRYSNSETDKEFTQEFQFSIETEVSQIKATAQQYLDELNFVPPPITDLTIETPETPTLSEAQIAKTAWIEDWRDLQAVLKLQSHGIDILSPAQLTALRDKVKSNFLNSYRDVV